MYDCNGQVYSDVSHLNWLEKWSDYENVAYTNILIQEKKQCAGNNILFTPKIQLKRKSYPKEYDFEDVQYFLDDLLETEELIQAELINA